MQTTKLRRAVAMTSLAVVIHVLDSAVGLCKPPIPTPVETPIVGEVDAFLLKAIYQSRNREASLDSVQGDPVWRKLVEKHDLKLLGGPMLGCVTANSAKIWLRTVVPSSVSVRYRPHKSREAWKLTPVVQTSAEQDYTARLTLSGLAAWTEYEYEVLVDGEPIPLPVAPVFRSNPKRGQAVEFSVAFGGGARYVPEKERMWSTIARQRPHAFLFLGDNLYIDEPEWRNRQRAMYYRRQMRPEYRELVSQTAAYAIWDDHDFGKNDVSGGLAVDRPAWKIPTWKVFQENWVNPAYGGGEDVPGCWFQFSIGDVDFFMTDGRYYRSFKNGTMLGPRQKAWLLGALKKSTAKFKVIASGTLWTEHADKGGRDSWWGVQREREEIFSLIDQQPVTGVILLSADRHRTDIYRIRRPNGYDLFEFETSKLTNNHTHPTRKPAIFSYNQGNFYGLLRFNLKAADPVMTFECRSIEDRLIYQYPVKLSQLKKSP